MKTLVVGLGNPILGDDGVGWRVAEEMLRQKIASKVAHMIQFPGPPSVPPVLPFEFDEERPERDPQKKQHSSSYGFRNRWSWIAGALFAGLAILLKLLLLPRFEPSALFAGLAAFMSATALWKWLLPRRDAVSAARGALAQFCQWWCL